MRYPGLQLGYGHSRSDYQCKLVAANSRGQQRIRKIRRKPLGKYPEACVARRMAELVVDAFEPIQIKKNQCSDLQSRIVCLRRVEKAVLINGAICQTRQSIVFRQMSHRFPARLIFGDVLFQTMEARRLSRRPMHFAGKAHPSLIAVGPDDHRIEGKRTALGDGLRSHPSHRFARFLVVQFDCLPPIEGTIDRKAKQLIDSCRPAQPIVRKIAGPRPYFCQSHGSVEQRIKA